MGSYVETCTSQVFCLRGFIDPSFQKKNSQLIMAAFARTLAACAVLSARLATTCAAAPIYGFGVTQGDQYVAVQ